MREEWQLFQPDLRNDFVYIAHLGYGLWNDRTGCYITTELLRVMKNMNF